MKVYTLLFNPGEFQIPIDRFADPVVILDGEMSKDDVGDNGIFHGDNKYLIDGIITINGKYSLKERLNFNFLFFTKQHRQFEHETRQALLENIENITGTQCPGIPLIADIMMLYPFISVIKEGNELGFYIFTDISRSGGVSLRYYSSHVEKEEEILSWKDLVNEFKNSYSRYKSIRHLLNDNCWYSKWRDEYEMERKYTFIGIPDTWLLINRLYREILDGKLTRFIPELDMEFQVFDYESHIYEVINPESERGYISFIPQTDGKMTIKQKWFKQNAEIRKETVTWNNIVALSDSEEYAKKLCGGEVRKLPEFRRKRFDVNFESLDTGNIYGVYFDICRIPEHGYDEVFSQCEVEYCRTRTLQDMQAVIDEFEVVCNYVTYFLNRNRVKFEHNLYSKLDFVRDAYNNKHIKNEK